MSGNTANNRIRAPRQTIQEGVDAFLARRSANNWRAQRQAANEWARRTGRPHWEMPQPEPPPQQPRPLPRQPQPQYESILLTSMGERNPLAEEENAEDEDYGEDDDDNDVGEEEGNYLSNSNNNYNTREAHGIIRAMRAITPEEKLINSAIEAIAIRESYESEITDPFDVHTQARILKERTAKIIAIIKKDLKTNKNYSNIGDFLDNTIGKYIKDPESKFNGKESNSHEQTLGKWLYDYEVIKRALITSATEENKEEIGVVVDFAFKYNLQECYIIGFIYDNANAYNKVADEHELLSCPGGIIERNISTLKNCIIDIEKHIKNVDVSVFDELKEALKATSWNTLDASEQINYKNIFKQFLINWTASVKDNERIRSQEPNVLFEMAMIVFKENNRQIPYFVGEYFRDYYKLLQSDNDMWNDYFDGNVTMNNATKTSNNNIQKAQKEQMEKIRAARALAASGASGGRRYKRNTKKIKKSKKVRTMKRRRGRRD